MKINSKKAEVEKQWIYIKNYNKSSCDYSAYQVAVFIHIRQGFLVVHNRSPKKLARLKHAITQSNFKCSA